MLLIIQIVFHNIFISDIQTICQQNCLLKITILVRKLSLYKKDNRFTSNPSEVILITRN